MITKKLPFKAIIQFSIIPIVMGATWSILVTIGFTTYNLKWLAVPFLPISLLGIAVSFIPIRSITRNLEIEILQSLSETDLPKPMVSKNGVLM
jgi:hypothetical protein